MVFKRRHPRNLSQRLRNIVYPGGGWARSASYLLHRLRRLPDSPERIAKGIGAGIMVSFTPLFGLHFFAAVALAWGVRGNILAALLATFVGNPFTFPLIAVSALELGNLILGRGHTVTLGSMMRAMRAASSELGQAPWQVLRGVAPVFDDTLRFLAEVFLPYLLGGTLLGAAFGVGGALLSLPLIRAHRKRRLRKLEDRFARARARSGAGN